MRGACPPSAVIEAAPADRLVHDAGAAKGRLERMAAVPGADAVVFGHSHIPLHEATGGFQIFNPGSPTDRRRQPATRWGRDGVAGGRRLRARDAGLGREVHGPARR